jgi:hypothetical protein
MMRLTLPIATILLLSGCATGENQGLANFVSTRSYQQRLADDLVQKVADNLDQTVTAAVSRIENKVETNSTINELWPWLIAFLVAYAIDKVFKYNSLAKTAIRNGARKHE